MKRFYPQLQHYGLSLMLWASAPADISLNRAAVKESEPVPKLFLLPFTVYISNDILTMICL